MRHPSNYCGDRIIDEINARLDRLEATRPERSAEVTQPPPKLQSSEIERLQDHQAIVEQMIGVLNNRANGVIKAISKRCYDSINKDRAKLKQRALDEGWLMHIRKAGKPDEQESPINETNQDQVRKTLLAALAII